MAFKESEHPRDADGKFVKGAGGSKDPDPDEIAKEIFPHLTGEKNRVKIDSRFFAEKESDFPKQESASIKRSVRKLKRRILEHEDKIAHPEAYSAD